MKTKLITLIIILLILSACSPATAQPTPRQTELTSAPRAALLSTPHTTKHYIVDRANDSDLAGLKAQGFTGAILRFNMKTGTDYRPSWVATMKAANAAGMQVIAWPADWDHPRDNCGHESPFPISVDGNINLIKPLLDVLVEYGALGVITVHEAQSNCPMTVQEMIGLRSKIVDYTAQKGHVLQVWNYVGVSKFLQYPSIYTAENVPAMMDVLLSYKFCEGRTDYPCESLPGRILADRAKMDALGLTGKVDYVFMLATYVTTYSPYNVRQSLTRAEQVAKSIIDTNALDGFGYYTYRADWWGDLYDWPEMYPLISYCRDLLYSGVTSTPQPVTNTPVVTPSKTPTPSKTVTPALTSTATIAPSKTPTATPAPGCAWTVYEQSADTIVLKCK